MVTTQLYVPRYVLRAGADIMNRLFNASKQGRGRILSADQQIQLETEQGSWYITSIHGLKWVGPTTLAVHGHLAMERSDTEKGLPVRMEFSDSPWSMGPTAEIEVKHDVVRLSAQTREYYGRFADRRYLR